MHKSLIAVTDSTKEVLIGKRNSNCISCAAGKQDGLASLKHFEGKDGKLYIQDHKNTLQTEQEKTTKSRSPKIMKRRHELKSAVGYRRLGAEKRVSINSELQGKSDYANNRRNMS